MRRLLLALFIPLAFHISNARADSAGYEVSARAVVHEMNLARTNPAQYATFIEEVRAHFHGNILVLPGRTMLRTKEGVRALDEAIRF